MFLVHIDHTRSVRDSVGNQRYKACQQCAELCLRAMCDVHCWAYWQGVGRVLTGVPAGCHKVLPKGADKVCQQGVS
jgi:hypothetical protein